MRPIFILFTAAFLLLGGCGTTRQTMVKGTLVQIPSYQEEMYWVPASHQEALVNRKENEDGSLEEPHIRKIRFKDGHWGSKKELIKRLREEYGSILEIKEKTELQSSSTGVQGQDDWPFKELSSSGR